MPTTDAVKRRLTWSMRKQNAYGSIPAKIGWLLLGIGLIFVWRDWPHFSGYGWIAPAVAVIGLLLAFLGYLSGRRLSRLLSTGAIAGGKIVGIKPTGASLNYLPRLEVTYEFTTADGNAYQVTGLAPLTPRLAMQAMYDLLDWLVIKITERAKEKAEPESDPTTHPVVQQLLNTNPMDLLRRMATEGWNAVVKEYTLRLMGNTAVEAVAGLAVTQQAADAPADASASVQLSAHLKSRTDSWLDAAHEKITARIGTANKAGQFAVGLLDKVHGAANEKLHALIDPREEIIFYNTRKPDNDAIPASALPYGIELREDGRLRGGFLPFAILVTIIPTLVIYGHGIYAVIRFWPR